MANLYVQVNELQVTADSKQYNKISPIDPVTVSWSDTTTQGSSSSKRCDQNGLAILTGVPQGSAFTVRVHRSSAPEIKVRVLLRNTAKLEFPLGRPSIMSVATQETLPRTSLPKPILNVTLYPPEEVIICLGADTHNKILPPDRPAWTWQIGKAINRFGAMLDKPKDPKLPGIVIVNKSCVLTLFTFNDVNSIIYRFIPGRGSCDVPAFKGVPAPVVLMELKRKEEKLSTVDIYKYLAEIGSNSKRKGTVVALDFLSHSYWMGPCLENDFRNEHKYCNDGCPVNTDHGHDKFKMPTDMKYQEVLDTSPIKFYARDEVEIHSRFAKMASTEHNERDPKDRDPRNTDFCHKILSNILLNSGHNLEDLQNAFHPKALLRVWGCNTGDVETRFLKAAKLMLPRGKQSKQPTTNLESWIKAKKLYKDNTLLRINSSFDGKLQKWDVRRADLQLFYLSRIRRSYPQAIATALNRPCYAGLLGNDSYYWFDKTKYPKLKNPTSTLKCWLIRPETANAIKPLANRLLNLSPKDRDEAGYCRYNPHPKKSRIDVSVLVCAFGPFPDDDKQLLTNNASACANQLDFSEVKNFINTPPWIDLNLVMSVETQVYVCWTIPQIIGKHNIKMRKEDKKFPTSVLRGGFGILQKAKEVDADIVVVIGEDPELHKAMRIERFARNTGMTGEDSKDRDNRELKNEVLFPGEPKLLEATMSRLTWARILNNIHSQELPVDTTKLRESCGSYICNETFYQLLRESVGDSGRWVVFVHVPHIKKYDWTGASKLKKLSRGLVLVVGTLVEEMMWATDIYGRKVFEEGKWKSELDKD
jgi:pyrrolidone-carboxylate peptidase